ncbi:MAG: tyrosine-type recombinase/integrase [Oscillospiraceae bacterium]|nr:tyrosine-type recombinase/integrase [Oscillospiraceae bacterium]
MERRVLTDVIIIGYSEFLITEEKSKATCEKYIRDVRRFKVYTGGEPVTKEMVVAWKNSLVNNYAVRSVNSMLAAVNSLFDFLGWSDCKVKNLKLQKQMYCAEEKELKKTEYLRLLEASKKNIQLNLVLQTICGTGIRVSELKYFTAEAVAAGEVNINCKSKVRRILIPGKLRKLLLDYARKRKITEGAIFVGKNGAPLDRSCIWRQMKRLCEAANVKESKVFPHNLRKLFARSFYIVEKDIAQLADVLGHSNINTTRIYIMTTGEEHLKKIERLGLVV